MNRIDAWERRLDSLVERLEEVSGDAGELAASIVHSVRNKFQTRTRHDHRVIGSQDQPPTDDYGVASAGELPQHAISGIDGADQGQGEEWKQEKQLLMAALEESRGCGAGWGTKRGSALGARSRGITSLTARDSTKVNNELYFPTSD